MKILFVLLTLIAVRPAPATDFNLVGSEMVRVLEDGHYTQVAFNRNFSERIFDLFIDSLDPKRLYLLQSDVDEFSQRYRRRLHELIVDQLYMEAAEDIYVRYLQRVRERQNFVTEEAMRIPLTFDSDRTVPLDRTRTDWAGSSAIAAKRWSLLVEELLLKERLRRGEKATENELRIAVRRILNNLLGEATQIDEKGLADLFLSALAQAYDPHSDYFSAQDTQSFYSRISNETIGIGITFEKTDPGVLEVIAVAPGSPADLTKKIRPGTKIVAIQTSPTSPWQRVANLSEDSAADAIVGEAGSIVSLRLADAENPVVTIKRAAFQLQDGQVSAKLVKLWQHPEESDPGPDFIGPLPKPIPPTAFSAALISIPSFYQNSTNLQLSVSVHTEVLLNRLQQEGFDALVLDLRGNGGGSVEQAIRLTGLFIGGGTVAQVKDGRGRVKLLQSHRRLPAYQGPLVVLVDQDSASASELFAGALQDHGRALIVGSTTYGKGTVQTPADLGNSLPFYIDRENIGTLKYTVQKYYRPSGGSVQQKGVVPDVVLPNLGDARENSERNERFALPYDIIQPAENFQRKALPELLIETLRTASTERISRDPEFQSLRERIVERSRQVALNSRSLNLAQRVTDQQESRKHRKKQRAEQQKRLQAFLKAEPKPITSFRLTLQDLWKERPTPLPVQIPDSPFAYGLEPAQLEAIRLSQQLSTLLKDPRLGPPTS